MRNRRLKKAEEIADQLEAELDELDNMIPEPSIEAEDKVVEEKVEETPVEAEDFTEIVDDQAVVASEQLKKLARVIYRKKVPLTASQKKSLQAKLLKIASTLKKADGEEVAPEDELKKTDIVKSVGRGFTKNGPLRTKIDWAELKSKGITPMTKLNELQLDDLRLILTKVRGIGG